MTSTKTKSRKKTSDRFLTVPKFSGKAASLRKYFESIYANPHSTHPKRFVWDYWNVPDQYTHLRTPAWEFFPEALYQQFHSELVRWGQKNLGCHDISPPWLSMYVEGCRQAVHCDVPHGPWAFVYSLSPEQLLFKGGETEIFRPEFLSFWHSRLPGFERKDLMDMVPPRFNQLLVFDGRFPHGVNEVRGVQDPRQARLVIHGWFVNPRPFVEGALKPEESFPSLDELVDALGTQIAQDDWTGTLCLELMVSPSGNIRSVKSLTNLVRNSRGEMAFGKSELEATQELCTHMHFRKKSKGSRIVVPIYFEA